MLTGNVAEEGGGGGAAGGTLNNCTLTGNSADIGGGAAWATLANCIVYYNTSAGDANCFGCGLNYCCTTLLPDGGTGNITAEPLLTDVSHISAGSPCRGAGSAAYTSGVDIDGEAWANPPSIGCDEYYSGSITGLLSVVIQADYTNVATVFEVNFMAEITGHASANRWEFGDGTVVSNRLGVSHSWTASGDYPVILRAYNESYPDGVSATATVHVVEQPVQYVALDSINPVSPYTSWATAATNIQDAVDAAILPGSLILVTNGVYATGGRAVYGTVTNRIAVTNPVTVRSVNGPEFTMIEGYQVPGTTNGDGAIRCVYLTNSAKLAGFTLTNGATQAKSDYPFFRMGGGGAVWCGAGAAVFNCVLTGNAACEDGGGACGGTLNNCLLCGNSTGNGGGGAHSSTLINCTLSGNSAANGGGADTCILNNCIIYYNTAPNGPNYYSSTLNYCCTTPDPGGTGNITNEPIFVDQAGGNFRLQTNSPCINAGHNALCQQQH